MGRSRNGRREGQGGFPKWGADSVVPGTMGGATQIRSVGISLPMPQLGGGLLRTGTYCMRICPVLSQGTVSGRPLLLDLLSGEEAGGGLVCLVLAGGQGQV